MERLTIRNSDGSVSQPIRLNWADALFKLAAYEDSGLTPEQVQQMCQPIVAWTEPPDEADYKVLEHAQIMRLKPLEVTFLDGSDGLTEEERSILARAIQIFGKRNQFVVAIEEMSELTKELTKDLRGAHNADSIIEEIADVEIMLDQLKLMLFAFRSVRETRRLKLQRLAERIEEAEP